MGDGGRGRAAAAQAAARRCGGKGCSSCSMARRLPMDDGEASAFLLGVRRLPLRVGDCREEGPGEVISSAPRASRSSIVSDSAACEAQRRAWMGASAWGTRATSTCRRAQVGKLHWRPSKGTRMRWRPVAKTGGQPWVSPGACSSAPARQGTPSYFWCGRTGAQPGMSAGVSAVQTARHFSKPGAVGRNREEASRSPPIKALSTSFPSVGPVGRGISGSWCDAGLLSAAMQGF